MNRRTFLITGTMLAGSHRGLTPASSQVNSARPIRVIVGTPAGGAVDPYARLIAEHMARSLRRVIIVENKPSAGMNIAAEFVVNAPADGQLILVGTQALTAINASARSDPK